MNVAEFEDLLDRHGDDPANWPSGQQQPAAELLRVSEQARDLLHQARLLRKALSSAPVRADPALTDRIMQQIRRPEPPVQPARSAESKPGVLAALKRRLRRLF